MEHFGYLCAALAVLPALGQVMKRRAKKQRASSSISAGRPAQDMEGPGKRYNLYLDESTDKKAKRIGKGDRSLGVRRAIKAYPDDAIEG